MSPYKATTLPQKVPAGVPAGVPATGNLYTESDHKPTKNIRWPAGGPLKCKVLCPAPQPRPIYKYAIHFLHRERNEMQGDATTNTADK